MSNQEIKHDEAGELRQITAKLSDLAGQLIPELEKLRANVLNGSIIPNDIQRNAEAVDTVIAAMEKAVRLEGQLTRGGAGVIPDEEQWRFALARKLEGLAREQKSLLDRKPTDPQ